jgi:hypothetical protein
MIKTKKVFHTGLLFVLAGLMVAGFTRFGERDLTARLQQGPLDLDVPIVRQSIGTSCGEAAIVMAYNYAHPKTPISEQEAIKYATTNGYFTVETPPYTSPANMVNIAKFYADDVSTGTVRNSDQGLRLLVQKLQNGTPVIIDVLSNFADPGSEAHFVVVTGVSLDPNHETEMIIHYNDPLTGTKESASWSGKEGLWNAWQNNGDPGGPGWWLTIPPA